MGNLFLTGELRKAFINYKAQLDRIWGLDHGTWSGLKHLAHEAKIPVLQISLDVGQSLNQLVEMFKLLEYFHHKGVLFIGSGNLVHNLNKTQFSKR